MSGIWRGICGFALLCACNREEAVQAKPIAPQAAAEQPKLDESLALLLAEMPTSLQAAAPGTKAAAVLPDAATLADPTDAFADDLQLSDDVTENRAEARSGEVLVWRSADEFSETLWLRVSSAKPELLARRSGIWLASRDGIYEIRFKRRALATCNRATCEGADSHCYIVAAAHSTESWVTEAFFVNLSDGRQHLIGPQLPATMATALEAMGYQRELEVVSSFDTAVEVRIRTQITLCGASQADITVDAMLATVPLARLDPIASPREAAELLATDGPRAEPRAGDKQKERHVAAWLDYRQTLDDQGHWLNFHDLIEPPTADVPEPLLWPVAATRAPRRLRPAGLPPPNVVGLPAFAHDAEAETRAGWSWVRQDGAQRDALRARFGEVHKPDKK